VNDTLNALLLEDNIDDVSYLKQRLRRSRFRTRVQVEVQETLQDGLKFLADERNKVDVVLLDLNLPDSQGLETIERLLAEFPGTPVVVVTGMRDEELAGQALDLGAADFLTKGRVDPDEFMRMLLSASRRESSGGVERSPVDVALAQAVRTGEPISECCNCGKVKLGGQWIAILPSEKAELQEHLVDRLCPDCLTLLES